MAQGPAPAPDLFTALDLEPIVGEAASSSPPVAQAQAPPAPAVSRESAPAPEPSRDEDAPDIGSAELSDATRRRMDAAVHEALGVDPADAVSGERPAVREDEDTLVRGVPGTLGGLADLLEPDSGEFQSSRARGGSGELERGPHPGVPADLEDIPTGKVAPRSARQPKEPEPAVASSAPASPAVAPSPPSSPPRAAPAPTPAGAGPVALELEEPEPRRRGGGPIALVALCLLLAGALGWVLYTQTDIFKGDLIALKEEAAKEQTEAEREAAERELERSKKEYGTITLNSEPKGGRAWLVKTGAEATYENLPRAHEYLFFVDAPGHTPQVRRIKGTEISAAITVDLDPSEPEGWEPPLPNEEPPRVAEQFDPEDVATLEIHSPDENVMYGLLVGFTPGVSLADLNAAEDWHILMTLDGHRPMDVIVKGRHWEEAGEGELVYSQTVTFEPMSPEELAPPEPEPVLGTDGELIIEDDGETGSSEEAEAAPPKPKKKKKKKKRKKKKKKH